MKAKSGDSIADCATVFGVSVKLVRGQLIKAMRGARSQAYINRKLGNKSNRCSRWERGVSQIKWSDFVRLAKLCDANLEAGLTDLSSGGDVMRYDTLIKRLGGNLTYDELGKRLGISKSELSKWINQHSEPSLDRVLEIIHVSNNGLLRFLSHIVDIKSVPCLNSQFSLAASYQKIYQKYPIVIALIKALKLKAYLRGRGANISVIAKAIDVTTEEIKFLLGVLEAEGLIDRKGNKFVSRITNEFVPLRTDCDWRNVHRFWHKRGIDLITDEKRSGMGSSGLMIFSVGKSTGRKIALMFRNCHEEAYRLASSDCQGEAVIAINYQLLKMSG